MSAKSKKLKTAFNELLTDYANQIFFMRTARKNRFIRRWRIKAGLEKSHLRRRPLFKCKKDKFLAGNLFNWKDLPGLDFKYDGKGKLTDQHGNTACFVLNVEVAGYHYTSDNGDGFVRFSDLTFLDHDK